jgi:prepilin-type N-terminal cleavage/methylation domain-containing protein
MRLQDPNAAFDRKRQSRGFTLAEVIIAIAIIVIIFGGIVTAYLQASYRAAWTGYSLAAESLAIKQIEQARSAVWDPSVGINQIFLMPLSNSVVTTSNMTGYTWANLELPSSGTNYARATNYISIKRVGSSGVTNIMFRVDTAWRFHWRKSTVTYTNTVCTLIAPDNRELDAN